MFALFLAVVVFLLVDSLLVRRDSVVHLSRGVCGTFGAFVRCALVSAGVLGVDIYVSGLRHALHRDLVRPVVLGVEISSSVSDLCSLRPCESWNFGRGYLYLCIESAARFAPRPCEAWSFGCVDPFLCIESAARFAPLPCEAWRFGSGDLFLRIWYAEPFALESCGWRPITSYSALRVRLRC